MERSNGAVKTAFGKQVDGMHGFERPKMAVADREGLQSGSSGLSTLMIDIPGDLV